MSMSREKIIDFLIKHAHEGVPVSRDENPDEYLAMIEHMINEDHLEPMPFILSGREVHLPSLRGYRMMITRANATVFLTRFAAIANHYSSLFEGLRFQTVLADANPGVRDWMFQNDVCGYVSSHNILWVETNDQALAKLKWI